MLEELNSPSCAFSQTTDVFSDVGGADAKKHKNNLVVSNMRSPGKAFQFARLRKRSMWDRAHLGQMLARFWARPLTRDTMYTSTGREKLNV